MRSTLAYTSARMLLLVAALGVFYLIGARGLTLLILALLASGIVSFVVLSKARDRMSASLTSGLAGMRGRVSEFSQRLDAGSRAEDEDDPQPPESAASQPPDVSRSSTAPTAS